MSLEGKKNTDKWYPIILIDDTDFKTAETGKAFGDVACKYSYEAATSLSTHTVTTAEWKEAGEGKYWLKIGASEFTSEGKYEVSVTVSGALVFNFAVEVRDSTGAEVVDLIDAIKVKTDNLPGNVPKNVALPNFSFLMVETDHWTPATGLTVTGTTSPDGGAFIALTNSVSEIANGIYKIDLTQAEMNYDIVVLRFTAPGADDRLMTLLMDS